MSAQFKDHRQRPLIAITGIGHVSCLGNSMAKAWQMAVHNHSGIARISKFNTDTLAVQIAGEVKNLAAEQHFPRKLLKDLDGFSVYCLMAAKEALLQAQLIEDGVINTETSPLKTEFNPDRIGVSIGSCMSGVSTLEHNFQRIHKGQRLEARVHPKYMGNMPAGQVSIAYNLRGPNWAVSTACATANHNIGLAARAIQWGEADIMIAGGTDEGVTPFSLGGYLAANALSKRNDDPAAASRPWDVGRDGFVLSEGAGLLVLETLEHALNRGVPVLGIVAGFGSAADAEHVTKPPKTGHGGARAQRAALTDAGITTQQLDYINAHGTSTPLGDFAELQGIQACFKQDKTPLHQVPISSTKSIHGHALGAAGGIEAGLCLQAMQENLIPATKNLSQPDRGCLDFDLVPETPRAAELNYLLSNSYGFGGTTSALVLAHPRVFR